MGWAVQLGGALLDAGAKRKQGEVDEKTSEANQRLDNYQADDALNRGSIEEQQYRRQLAQLMGKQRNEVGARNVEMRGSALRLLEDSAMIGEEDATTIRNNAARTAWGYRNNASEAARWGANQKSNANAAAAGTILTGAAQSYGAWKDSRAST